MSNYNPYWHAYHTGGMVFWIDYEERMEIILKTKPEEEHEARIHFMQPVIRKLPEKFAKAGRKYAEAKRKYDEAKRKYDEVLKKYEQAGRKYDEDKAGDKYHEAWDKNFEAWEKYIKARKKYFKAWKKHVEARNNRDKVRDKYAPEIEALHAKECPDCVWNGVAMIWENWKDKDNEANNG